MKKLEKLAFKILKERKSFRKDLVNKILISIKSHKHLEKLKLIKIPEY
jgi:hypothetical protein